MKRLEFLRGLVTQLEAGETTKAQGRKAIRSFDAAAKREAKSWKRIGLTVEQARASMAAR